MSLASKVHEKSLHKFHIMASDISRASLKQAAEGLYSQNEFKRGLPDKLSKFFIKEDRSYRIKLQLKKLIEFRQVNLGQIPLNFPQFDVILLRYVLIYFDEDKKQKALNKVIDKLKPGGYLILDPATSLKIKHPDIKQIRYKGQIIFIKEG